ncbi:hypothetical protein ACHQM5_005062 [Ranunculus cassubicifolius]
MSTPISFSSKPPSLLGNASVPESQEEEPPKQRRARGKKKKSKPQYEGGDTEMVSFAPGLIDSPPPSYQTKKKEFKFSEGASETEARSTGSPETLSDVDFSKVNLGPKKHQVPLEVITIRNSAGSISEGAETESDESESDTVDGDSHSDGECLESVIGRRLFELPCTHGLVNSFKSRVKINVLKQIRAVLEKEPTTELVLEIADSIDLLRLLGASNPTLDDMGRKARGGALLYSKGLEVMTKGQDMLRSCFDDISSLK